MKAYIQKAAVGLLILISFSALSGPLPDPRITPGAVNEQITPDNIQATICEDGHGRKGYTRLLRPPVGYTNKLKRLQIRKYGYSNTDPHQYEEDHLIPLCAGSLQIGSRPTRRM